MIGDKILEARKAKNWTQNDLARESKIQQAVIARYETGSSAPGKKNLEILAKHLGQPISYFLQKDVGSAVNTFNEKRFQKMLLDAKKLPLKHKLALYGILEGFLELRSINKTIEGLRSRAEK